MSVGTEGGGPNPRTYSRADYAALEAERNELQRRLDAADELATLASEQLKERDALAAELQAARGLLERITTACTLEAYGSSLHDARAFLDAAPPAAQDVGGLAEALEHARLFIRNGIDLGYIKMPEADTPDPAHDTLPKIDKALAAHRQAQQQERQP